MRHEKHGGSRTRLYNIWKMMKQRCFNPKAPNYSDYGGRGVSVCKAWKASFSAFRDWAVSSGYRDRLTIERRNVNGGYTPRNCTWIPKARQSDNTRRNVVVGGKNLSQWSRKLGINRGTVQARRRKGDTGKRLLRPRRKESSKYPGVSFDPTSKKKSWRARCGFGGKMYRLGRFATEEQAYEQVQITRLCISKM